ncbi:MAG: acyl-CoA dehydrogenase family protein [Chlamydiales bacterium]|nr:acyl-CoA dehydrogenase family protein [Chlamydiia bacterium]MCP5507390.1 acyl-CoA dehydrogenase family protein [Chlamydiales bacterium]
MDHEHQEQASAILAESVQGNEAKRQAMEVAEEARNKEYRQPSFGGKLFMGNFDPSLLFPFPEQDEEDKKIGDAYIAELEAFLKEHLDPEEVDRTHEIPKEVFEGLAKLKAFAMKIPKEYGGLGLSQVNYNRAVMKVASYCGATATLLSAHQSIGVPQPLKMYGTEEQRKKFFPRFAEGAISAFALTEEDVGSDPARMSTEAILSDDGTHYILNGTKLWCTNGTIADIIVVMAKTKPKIVNGKEKQQISAFILEMDAPGVEVLHRCEFMGLNGIYNGLIKFTDVKIPKENLIWDEGRGLAMALATINVGRLTLPAASAGGCKQMLSIARRWGKERVQWGQPIGEHETGQQKIAFIAATTFAIEAITKLTSKWQDEGFVDIRIEAAMAKLFATESMWKITDMTMQLRGGRGYETARSLKGRGETPYPVERAMRDCRINMILEGTSEIMKLFLAREAMDPHLNRAKDLLFGKSSFFKKLKTAFSLAGFYLTWYPAQFFKSLRHRRFPQLGKLEKNFQFIDYTSHELARSIFYYMAKYQQKLESKQMILGRLMEIGTDLFVMAATCSYATALYKKNPNDDTPIKLAEYFCTIAKRRVRKRLRALEDNDDRKADKLAREVLEDKMQWLEEGIVWIGPKD